MLKHPMVHLDEAGRHILRNLRPLRWHLLGMLAIVPGTILLWALIFVPEMIGVPDFFALGALQAVGFLFFLPPWTAFSCQLFYATGDALLALHEGRELPSIWSGMRISYVGVTMIKGIAWFLAALVPYATVVVVVMAMMGLEYVIGESDAASAFFGFMMIGSFFVAACLVGIPTLLLSSRMNAWAVHGQTSFKAFDKALRLKPWSRSAGTSSFRVGCQYGLGHLGTSLGLYQTTNLMFLAAAIVSAFMGWDAEPFGAADDAVTSPLELLAITGFYTVFLLPWMIGHLFSLQATIGAVAEEKRVVSGEAIEAALTRLEARVAA